MYSIDSYSVLIDEKSLVALTRVDERLTAGELTPEQTTTFEAEMDKAEAQAKAIITRRFGSEPADADFLETAVVAGVVYLLSRKPHNKVNQDEIDLRRDHFDEIVPPTRGSESRASVKTYPSRIGEWL